MNTNTKAFAHLRSGDYVKITSNFKTTVMCKCEETKHLLPSEDLHYTVLGKHRHKLLITASDHKTKFWIKNTDCDALKVLNKPRDIIISDPREVFNTIQRGDKIIVLVAITVGLAPKTQDKQMYIDECYRIINKQYGCLIVKESGSKSPKKYWIKARHANKIQKLTTNFDYATVQAEYLAMEKKTGELEAYITEKTHDIAKAEKFIDLTRKQIRNISERISENDQRLEVLQQENETLKAAQKLSAERNNNKRTLLVEDFDDLIQAYEETIENQLDIFEEGINRIQKKAPCKSEHKK